MNRMKLRKFRRLLRETYVPYRELAEEIGVSPTTLYRWRDGDTNPPTAYIADTVNYVRERAARISRVTSGAGD